MPGNLIRHKDAKWEIITASQIERYRSLYENDPYKELPKYYLTIRGIPITPSWLEALGFKSEEPSLSEVHMIKPLILDEMKKGYKKELQICWYRGVVSIESIDFKNKEDADVRLIDFDLPHVQYVHQIQNLFKSITGEDIKVQTKLLK